MVSRKRKASRLLFLVSVNPNDIQNVRVSDYGA